MDADELIKLGMDMSEPEVADLDQYEIDAIKNFAGGEESYDNLIGWASENIDAQYIDAFDSVVDTGNSAAIQLMVAGLMATYQENTQAMRDGCIVDGMLLTLVVSNPSVPKRRSWQRCPTHAMTMILPTVQTLPPVLKFLTPSLNNESTFYFHRCSHDGCSCYRRSLPERGEQQLFH